MASAGRILILPKGDYDSTKEYEMLDLVFHGGTSWLAKKSSVGVEPSDANTEYWFKMCQSVDLSEVIMRIAALESQMLGTISLDDIDLTPYATKEDLEGYLKLSGGSLTGDLNIEKPLPRLHLTNKDTSRKARIESSNDGTLKIGNYKSDTDHVSLQVKPSSAGKDELIKVVVDGSELYRVFGEHNIDLAKTMLGASNIKIATGSYTGTGTYGVDNKNSLTFDFEPKLVILSSPSTYGGAVIWYSGVEMMVAIPIGTSSGYQIQFEQDGKTLKWYQVGEAAYQLNTIYRKYPWIAIG